MTEDTPILRADIRTMTAHDYERELVLIRERQMANRRKFEEVERAKSLAHVDKLTPKRDNLIKQIRTKLDKFDVDIEKLSEKINKLHTLEQEIKDELAFAKLDHPELIRDGDDNGEGDETNGTDEAAS